jgi:multiple sugar transport system substrate-binding protein
MGGILDDSGRLIVNSVQNKRALDLMHDFIWKYRISPPNTHSELTEESSRHLFQQGKGLFLRNWTYVWDLCQKDPLMKGKVGISLLPSSSGGNPASVYGGWHLAISSRSKKKEQAWQLVEFLTSNKVQKELALNLSWAPTSRTLYNDPQLIENLPFLQVVEMGLKNIQIRPNLPYYQWISDVLQKNINKVLSNRMNSEEALSTIQKELEGIRNEFYKD